MKFMRQFISGILALLASDRFAWADPVARVVNLIGSVQMTRGQTTTPLFLGAALETGDKLNTDASSRAQLQLIDGSTINLGSQSEFSIDEVVSQGPGTDRHVGLDLWLGVLRAFAAPATQQSHFEIRTPKAITAVRGTYWGIYSFVTKSDIVVLEGIVGVRKNVASEQSAISLTRNIGVTVTDDGVGETSRWDPERIAALIAATDVPKKTRKEDCIGNECESRSRDHENDSQHDSDGGGEGG